MEMKNKTEISINSGIRQGCTDSTAIFKLLPYYITNKLESECEGYQDDVLKIVALFFAHDGLLLAKSVQEAERTIDKLVKVGEKCALNIKQKVTF